MKRVIPFFGCLILIFCQTNYCFAKDSLMVKNLSPQKGIDKQTAVALSDIVKNTLSDHYNVQSMDALAAVNELVEEKLKAGCDDTACIMEVAGAMDISLVVTGNISRFGSLYSLSLMMISTKGVNTGVIKRASDKRKCTEEELVTMAEKVALELIGKKKTASDITSSSAKPQDLAGDGGIKDCTMKIRISGSGEQVLSVRLKNFSKETKKNNKKGFDTGMFLVVEQPAEFFNTRAFWLEHPKKDPLIYIYYSQVRRIRKLSKTQAQTDVFFASSLTWKEFKDVVQKLIYQDQITVNGSVVSVLDRSLGYINPKLFTISALQKGGL